MASTADMAPERATTPRRSSGESSRRSAASRRAAAAREEELGAQIEKLQSDMKSIAATLASLAENKVNEAQSAAKREARNLARTGQQAVEDIQDEFGQIEKQIKETIRERPLTAVAGAVALGYILAVISR